MRAVAALHDRELIALPELEAAHAVAALSWRELMSHPNFGAWSCAAVVAWLAGHGLVLKTENPHAFAVLIRARDRKKEAPRQGDASDSNRSAANGPQQQRARPWYPAAAS
jgi:hypothetical protein